MQHWLQHAFGAAVAAGLTGGVFVKTMEVSLPVSDAAVAEIRQAMETDGCIILRGLLSPEASLRFGEAIHAEYARLHDAGWSFTGGGRLEGHLNIRPGEAGRELLDEAHKVDLAQIVSRISGEEMQITAMAGNYAVAGSVSQNFHMDSNLARETWIINMALVPTSAANGAMELVPASQRFGESYMKFKRAGMHRKGGQVTMAPGDLLLRLSTVWHRGTDNPSPEARPMGMFAFRPVSEGDAPYSIKPGQPLELRSNRYYGKYAGIREFAAIRFRPIYEVMRMFNSR